MKRTLALVGLVGLLVPAAPALAATRQASIGNYWFQLDDGAGDKTKMVVNQGDQITFTVRETAPTAHTVNVDALGIHSPELPALFQTYTTPALDRPGQFAMYCKNHRNRGHETLLIVQGPAATPAPVTPVPPTPPPAATARPAATAPPRTAAPATATPAPTPVVAAPAGTPEETLTPVGVGVAPPESRTQAVPVDPRSLEGILGRQRAAPVPWTRAVRLLSIALVPIVGAAALVLWRDASRPVPAEAPPPPPPPEPEPEPEREPARKPRTRSPAATKPQPKPKPKPKPKPTRKPRSK